ncbi:von Willebrand factor type A domain-containing protein [Nemania sp. NC0429]|nr:von Willebrand factor type A domain-containing protein [Nemania sp. NC0429]
MAYRRSPYWGQPACGCWHFFRENGAFNNTYPLDRAYLPLQNLKAHAVIKDVSSRTVLTQTFFNNSGRHLKDMIYSFPLYDGVSVVSFTATIGNTQIQGVVKEKQQARREYQNAVNSGRSAGLLEQINEASDVFATKIGNVANEATVVVEVVLIGELRHDAELNGTRFTIPAFIAPRYGADPKTGLPSYHHSARGLIQVVIDFQSPEGCPIQQIQSPSHRIAVTVGRTTDMPTTAYMANRASATFSFDSAVLDKDFVVIANVKDLDVPKAFLETHPTIPAQRALMATLVPRFNLAPTYGEVVFIVDRSGSMIGKMKLVIQAMTILLKSLPVGVKFNVCSFGTQHAFLWPRSKSYNDENLDEALTHVGAFQTNFGGTNILNPVKATISQRFTDMLLDAIILTDGEIWDQQIIFDIIRQASSEHKCRFFSLGIGPGASTALVEGIATAGSGVSQFVDEGEKMDKKMVRLLKAALTPHIEDYSLEVKYKQDEDDFEIIESVNETSEVAVTSPTDDARVHTANTPLCFFDDRLDPDRDGDVNMIPLLTNQDKFPLGAVLYRFENNNNNNNNNKNKDKFAHLPEISPPAILQAPYRVSPLYPFSRTTVYMLLDPSTYHKTPEAIILRATSPEGPIELEIKVEDIGQGETIHQLAAKRAVSELEKDGGWLTTATDKVDNTPIKNKYDGRWEEIVEREAVRLGVKYQIAGKWCSFVAVEGNLEHEAIIMGSKPPPPSSRQFRATSTASRAPPPPSGRQFRATSTMARAAQNWIPSSEILGESGERIGLPFPPPLPYSLEPRTPPSGPYGSFGPILGPVPFGERRRQPGAPMFGATGASRFELTSRASFGPRRSDTRGSFAPESVKVSQGEALLPSEQPASLEAWRNKEKKKKVLVSPASAAAFGATLTTDFTGMEILGSLEKYMIPGVDEDEDDDEDEDEDEDDDWA